MSSSAALAAAKKRRNVGFGEASQNINSKISQQQQQQQPRASTSMTQLVAEHDIKLYAVERLMNGYNSKFALKQDLELLQTSNPSSHTSNIDNAVTNKVEKQEKELFALTQLVNKLNKTITDANTTITTLKATVIAQSKEVTDLKDLKLEFNKFVEDYQQPVVSQSVETEVASEVASVKETATKANKKNKGNTVSLEIKEQ